MTYTSEEFEVPKNLSRNNIQKGSTTDPIDISDGEDIPKEDHILISDSEDSDITIYSDVEWEEGDVYLNDVISDIDSAFNSDSETETDSTKSDEEETPANSRKRKNSFVTHPIPKKSRGN